MSEEKWNFTSDEIIEYMTIFKGKRNEMSIRLDPLVLSVYHAYYSDFELNPESIERLYYEAIPYETIPENKDAVELRLYNHLLKLIYNYEINNPNSQIVKDVHKALFFELSIVNDSLSFSFAKLKYKV